MYDFHKVKQENDNLVFKNPLFQKGEQGQLKDIKRKAAKKPFNGYVRRHDKIHPENEKYFSVPLEYIIDSQNSEEICRNRNQSVFPPPRKIPLPPQRQRWVQVYFLPYPSKLKVKLIADLDTRTSIEALDSLFLLK